MAEPLEHPDATTWEHLVLGEVAPAERDAWFDHILACESCTRVWRGVLALQSGAQAGGLIPAAAAPASAGWMRSTIPYVAIAATLALVVAGVVTRQSASDVSLSGEPTALRSNAAVGVEQLTTTFDAGVPLFRWAPLPAATGYRVGVFSADGQVIWTRDVAAPPLSWPPDVARAPGAYRWRVEAVTGGGVIGSSRLAELEMPR